MKYDEFFDRNYLGISKKLCEDFTNNKQKFGIHSQFNCVYFIKSQDYIKIGATNNLFGRIEQYKIYCPKPELVGLSICNDPNKLESEIHLKFNIHRINSEWFNYNKELLFYLKGIMDKGDLLMLRKMNKYLALKNKSRSSILHGKKPNMNPI